MKPVLFVTNHVPPDRVGAFAALDERVPLQLALFGGRSHHATAAVADPGVPHIFIAQRDASALAADAGAVVCGTAGRIALPAAFRGARRAGVPFILWSALWEHPRTLAHRFGGGPLLNRIYKKADAVVTYGPHVSEFVRARGATQVFEAPQAVDGAFWSASRDPGEGPLTFVFVGRDAPYKGLPGLLAAWRLAGLEDRARLLVVGQDRRPGVRGVLARPSATPEDLRNIYAASDVLVMPAISTRSIREPWGLVANEAMHQGLPVIATDAVGAAAGGLVRDERNGLVVPQRQPAALAAALTRLAGDRALVRRLGDNARQDVSAHTFGAWADGFVAALRSAGYEERGA